MDCMLLCQEAHGNDKSTVFDSVLSRDSM